MPAYLSAVFADPEVNVIQQLITTLLLVRLNMQMFVNKTNVYLLLIII